MVVIRWIVAFCVVTDIVGLFCFVLPIYPQSLGKCSLFVEHLRSFPVRHIVRNLFLEMKNVLCGKEYKAIKVKYDALKCITFL